jgi:homoserine O-acetyltransferase
MSHYRDAVTGYETLQLGDFEFQSGVVLPDAKLTYKTYGSLNSERSNAVLVAVPVNGTHQDAAAIHIEGDNRAINPDDHFIIIPDMFGNGLSSSPSNTPSPFDGPNFPAVTIYDNVRAQHALVTEKLGISKLKLVTGFSMGGLQAYHWAAMYPDMVENVVPICSAAKCSGHNWLFLDSLAVGLKADSIFDHGRYTEYPEAGMRAFCAIYAAWAYSQEFFKQDGHKLLGLSSHKEMADNLAQRFVPQDPNDLLIRTRAWQNADISDNSLYNGDLKAALRAITAKAVVMPSSTDQYFWSDDSRDEVEAMANAEFKEIPSIWGHVAPSGRGVEARKFMDDAIRDLIG